MVTLEPSGDEKGMISNTVGDTPISNTNADIPIIAISHKPATSNGGEEATIAGKIKLNPPWSTLPAPQGPNDPQDAQTRMMAD